MTELVMILALSAYFFVGWRLHKKDGGKWKKG